MRILNALIEKARLGFDDVGGKDGQQFSLSITIKDEEGWNSYLQFNPMRLPQLLQELGLESFSELEGTYIKVMDNHDQKPAHHIANILKKEQDVSEWFETENTIYFGSNFFKGYGEKNE